MVRKKTQPLFQIDLEQNGGLCSFATGVELKKWILDELECWSWLSEAKAQSGTWAYVNGHLSGLVSWVETNDDPANPDALLGRNPIDHIGSFFRNTPPLLYHSGGRVGQAILALKHAQGVEEAALAYALLMGQVSFDVRQAEHLRVLVSAAFPAILGVHATTLAQSEALEALTKRSTEIAAEQAQVLKLARQKITEAERRGERRAAAVIRKFEASARATKTSLTESGEQIINRLEATDKAYAEKMHLMAAVEYWNSKKNTHTQARGAAYGHLITFAKRAVLAAIATFILVLAIMLDMAGVNALPYIDLKPGGGGAVPAAAYVIVTGTAATILTAIFWAARVLLKNYLTERMLERDSDERRVMTLTYLALVKDGHAEEMDRIVILNALFRPSPEPHSRDEASNSEVGLPAVVARLLDHKPSG